MALESYQERQKIPEFFPEWWRPRSITSRSVSMRGWTWNLTSGVVCSIWVRTKSRRRELLKQLFSLWLKKWEKKHYFRHFDHSVLWHESSFPCRNVIVSEPAVVQSSLTSIWHLLLLSAVRQVCPYATYIQIFIHCPTLWLLEVKSVISLWENFVVHILKRGID